MNQTERIDPYLETIWAFVRGDMEPAAFEKWVYAVSGLEAQLGDQLYLDVISADYSNLRAVGDIKASLEVHAEENTTRRCACITLRDGYRISTVVEAEAVFESFENRIQRGGSFWWISARQCVACRQDWLVAGDPQEYEFLMRRLSPKERETITTDHCWPDEFNDFKILRPPNG